MPNITNELPHEVYQGFWIDRGNGTVLGSTLTLSEQKGNIFLSFLAIFVKRSSVVETGPADGSSLQTNRDPQCGLYYQQQNVLRNENNNVSSVLQLLLLAYEWRKKVQNVFRRSFPLFIIAFLHGAGWTVASLFTSRVMHTSGRVLISKNDSTCGYLDLNLNGSTSPADRGSILNDILWDLDRAWSYADSCYQGNSESMDCIMPGKALPRLESFNVTCPFDDLCWSNDKNSTAPYSVDSDRINSNKQLGINAPPSDQVNYYRSIACAPLNTTGKGFLRQVNVTSESDFPAGDSIVRLEFGSNSDFSAEGNATYVLDTRDPNKNSTGYKIYIASHPTVDMSNEWLPIPQLNRSGADTNLIFLSANSIEYREPVDDPIYAAHTLSTGSKGFYQADDYVTVLGCIEQHQFCLQPRDNNEEQFCTDSSDTPSLEGNLDALRKKSPMNDAQYGTARRIAASARRSTLSWVLTSRQERSLDASTTVLGIEQTYLLAPSQWQYDVYTWAGTSFAYMQRSILQYAANDNYYLMKRPNNRTWDENMCKIQLRQISNEYKSFSFLGIALIIVIGTIIIITGWFVDWIVALFWPLVRPKKYSQRGEVCSRAWNLDNKFQLQRLAFEGKSSGDWKVPDARIPRTLSDEKLDYYDD